MPQFFLEAIKVRTKTRWYLWLRHQRHHQHVPQNRANKFKVSRIAILDQQKPIKFALPHPNHNSRKYSWIGISFSSDGQDEFDGVKFKLINGLCQVFLLNTTISHRLVNCYICLIILRSPFLFRKIDWKNTGINIIIFR